MSQRMYKSKNNPANTKHLYNICTTLAQRLRRWSNFVQMLYKCFVLAGLIVAQMCYNSTVWLNCKEEHTDLSMTSNLSCVLSVLSIGSRFWYSCSNAMAEALSLSTPLMVEEVAAVSGWPKKAFRSPGISSPVSGLPSSPVTVIPVSLLVCWGCFCGDWYWGWGFWW